jgi:hypothetical protein
LNTIGQIGLGVVIAPLGVAVGFGVAEVKTRFVGWAQDHAESSLESRLFLELIKKRREREDQGRRMLDLVRKDA